MLIARTVNRALYRLLLSITLLISSTACSQLVGSPLIDSGLLPQANGVAQPDDVTVTFLGVSTLLFSDGQTHLMVDGFFSRPTIDKVLLNQRISPNVKRIDKALDKLTVTAKPISTLSAVLVSHSHYDHAMDAGLVAGKMNAQLLGSESTKHIAIGTRAAIPKYPIADDRIHVVIPGEPYPFGRFIVTFYQSKHFDLTIRRDRLLGTVLTAPLDVPAKVTDYAEGTTYSIHIAHPQGNAIVQTSANFLKDALAGVSADVAFLGVSAPGKPNLARVKDYWHDVVGQTNARRVYPIHWDNPTRPLVEPIRTLPLFVDPTVATVRTLQNLTLQHCGQMQVLPVGVPIPIYQSLNEGLEQRVPRDTCHETQTYETH